MAAFVTAEVLKSITLPPIRQQVDSGGGACWMFEPG
jgi:hypothetical protein